MLWTVNTIAFSPVSICVSTSFPFMLFGTPQTQLLLLNDDCISDSFCINAFSNETFPVILRVIPILLTRTRSTNFNYPFEISHFSFFL